MLRCALCGSTQPLGEAVACDRCFGPLHVAYDLTGLVGRHPGQVLERGRSDLWRYAALLPSIPPSAASRLGQVGGSPLRRADRLAEAWGLKEVWLKDDTGLPSGSFKDRPAAVAVGRALALGLDAVGCASTGNLAAATARAAARAGLPCHVLVPKGLPRSKLWPALVFGAHLREVEGSYDQANRLGNLWSEGGRVGWVNITLRPYYAEGSKTLAFESLEALEWEAPDWIGVPLGSGALLSATGRAVAQVRELGWLAPSGGGAPAIFGSQPQGCAPIVDAFQRRSDDIVPVREPDTIAESLAIGDPASGLEALQEIRTSGGFADAPSAAEVRQAILDLARWEGIWVEPAGGTVLASLRRGAEEGTIHPTDRVVVFLTGAGWKTPDVLGPAEAWSHPIERVGAGARPGVLGGAPELPRTEEVRAW